MRAGGGPADGTALLSVLNALLFKSLPLASAVCGESDLPGHVRGFPRHTLTLGWEDRVKARGRRCTDEGLQFGAALPRGTILRAGDCLVLDSPAVIVVIREAAEPVLVVRPASAEQSAVWAYLIGNSHQPLMITADTLVCADVPGMEQVLAYHQIPFTRVRQPFTPVSQAPGHHGEP